MPEIISSLISIIPAMVIIALVLWQGKKLETVHTLVNSNYGVALKLNADNARWRANSSKKPVDIQAAQQAEALLKDHIESQKKVDAKT